MVKGPFPFEDRMFASIEHMLHPAAGNAAVPQNIEEFLLQEIETAAQKIRAEFPLAGTPTHPSHQSVTPVPHFSVQRKSPFALVRRPSGGMRCNTPQNGHLRLSWKVDAADRCAALHFGDRGRGRRPQAGAILDPGGAEANAP